MGDKKHMVQMALPRRGGYAEKSVQAVGSEEEGQEQRRAEMGLVRPVLWTVLSGPLLH